MILTDPSSIALSLARLDEEKGLAFCADDRAEHESLRRDLDPLLLEPRRRAAWRIAREVARLQGWLAGGEPLWSLLDRDDASDPDGALPYFEAAPPGPRPVELRLADEAALAREVDHTIALEELPVDLSPARLRQDREARRWLARLPLLPPVNGLRARWFAVVAPLSLRLPLCRDDVGSAAWRELFCPEPLLGAWPEPDELLATEEALVERAARELVRRGAGRAALWCRDELGLSPREVESLGQLARARVRDLASGDVDTKRAIMELRLEDLTNRCRAAKDLRAEIMSVKALAVVQGVTRAEPEDLEDEFVRAVRAAPAQGAQRRVLDIGGTST